MQKHRSINAQIVWLMRLTLTDNECGKSSPKLGCSQISYFDHTRRHSTGLTRMWLPYN